MAKNRILNRLILGLSQLWQNWPIQGWGETRLEEGRRSGGGGISGGGGADLATWWSQAAGVGTQAVGPEI